ncbi:MAG: hypothetical protein ACREFP_09900 [Acetobacteraceae bacterium]
MDPILASIVGALAAGALAKLQDVGGKAVSDAYDALRTLIVRKLGGSEEAVQGVEHGPKSGKAQEALAEAISNAGAAKDTELEQHAAALREQIPSATGAAGGDINVGDIIASASVMIRKLAAEGRIKIGNVYGHDVTIEDLVTARNGTSKKP